MFATDRDILGLEPFAFRDLTWAGQVVCSGTATIIGTLVEVTGDSNDLETGGIEAGHVLTVNGVSYELIERSGAQEATVSLLRAGLGDPPIAPPGCESQPAYVMTFRPQIAAAHAWVMRLAGIDPDAPAATGVPTAAAITNPRAIAQAEALGALYLIYSAAGATGAGDSPLNQRAAMYRERFNALRARLKVELDLDGDGVTDATRSLAGAPMVRG